MAQAAANGAGSGEFKELKQLLVGPEIEQLADVRERLEDPARRSADVAQVLPEAIQHAKPRALRESLEPVVEKAFHSTVRKNPKELADAIYPIMGPAIRTSIAAAIRDFAEALNQIVEKSVSFRALRWRVESVITGKPFGEILLSRSLLYSVEQVFLIHRRSGILLQHVAAQGAVVKDADMVSGMLTAIQDFVSDSFAGGAQDLETVDAGRFKLWMIYGQELLLAGAVSGTAPAELRGVFRKALDGIEEALASQIAAFKGDVSAFEPAQPFLEKCLLGQSAPEKRKKARLWPYFAAIALIVAVVVFFQIRARSRWNAFFDALKGQPGIVVTGIERHGSDYYEVSGLKDPQAADPAAWLAARGLDARDVHFHWQPYFSLDPAFTGARAVATDKEWIEREIIRFDIGSSKLPVGESDQIDQLSVVIGRFFSARPNSLISVTGRTDEVGTAAMNMSLSAARAQSVIESLVGPGIPASRFRIVGMGDSAPLRTGGSDWDKASNRSVSFKVIE